MDKQIHQAGRANESRHVACASQHSSKVQKGNSNGRAKRRSENASRNSHHKEGLSNFEQREVTRGVSTHICALCTEYLTSILCDARGLQPGYGSADLRRDVDTTSRRMAAEGIQFATVTLPSFFDSLLDYLETGKSASYPSFKKVRGQTYPVYLKGLVGPIYADPHSDTAVKNIELVYQFCVAFKKLEGTAVKSVLRKQLSDFIQDDIDLSYLDWSVEPVRDIARKARHLIGEVTKGLDPFDRDQSEMWKPRPGPGATNTPTKHADRFRPSVWYDKLMSTFELEDWFRPPFCPPHTQPRKDVWFPLYTGNHNGVEGCRRITRKKLVIDVASDHGPRSRFKFVPKTFTKWRGICIEENELQWYQQALRRGLYDHLEHHPLTRGYVNFTSQLVNRNLALRGSVDKIWATIDMSSASDRISRNLVAYLFGENKQLLRAIEACSSDEVELPKDAGKFFVNIMPLKKIAPMGSAICFPIMSLVHYALIKAILAFSSLPHALTRDVYVYGDDIIVRRECIQAIYDYLPMFGMKINTDKSFSHSYFRESCGLHAYKGRDITPVRFKRILHTSASPADLATALRLEEAFYYKGFKATARCLRNQIRTCLQQFRVQEVPYVDTCSPIVGFYRREGEATLSDFKIIAERYWRGGTYECNPPSKRKRSKLPTQSWIYKRVAVLVDKFDEESSFQSEEERYLRYLLQGGSWASKKYVEGFSRHCKIVRMDVPESALGYRS